jgi:hypothetical protein
MRAHHEIDVLDAEAGRLQRTHPVAIVLLVPCRPQRKVLVVADAAIDQDVMVRRLDDIRLEAQYDVPARAVVAAGRQPGQILAEGFLRQCRQEVEHRREAALLLDDPVDGHVVDGKTRAHRSRLLTVGYPNLQRHRSPAWSR